MKLSSKTLWDMAGALFLLSLVIYLGAGVVGIVLFYDSEIIGAVPQIMAGALLGAGISGLFAAAAWLLDRHRPDTSFEAAFRQRAQQRHRRMIRDAARRVAAREGRAEDERVIGRIEDALLDRPKLSVPCCRHNTPAGIQCARCAWEEL